MAQLQIRIASAGDLPRIYRLAAACATHDRFSPELLREKLFFEPRPAAQRETAVAERGGELIGFMQRVLDPQARKAWIGPFAVAESARRQGVAGALLESCLDALRGAAGEVEALAIPGAYLTPGLDPRYTEALCFLERRGFERFKDCANLTAELTRHLGTADDEARLAREGVEIRRAQRADEPRLDAFFEQDFGAAWRFEAGLALDVAPPALHLALRGGRIIAFSAHSTQNREWGFFGPMGTAPAARGLGLGRVLLWRCLNDLRDAGHETAVIPWVGPIAFYHQWCQARVERVFWRYRRML